MSGPRQDRPSKEPSEARGPSAVEVLLRCASRKPVKDLGAQEVLDAVRRLQDRREPPWRSAHSACVRPRREAPRATEPPDIAEPNEHAGIAGPAHRAVLIPAGPISPSKRHIQTPHGATSRWDLELARLVVEDGDSDLVNTSRSEARTLLKCGRCLTQSHDLTGWRQPAAAKEPCRTSIGPSGLATGPPAWFVPITMPDQCGFQATVNGRSRRSMCDRVESRARLIHVKPRALWIRPSCVDPTVHKPVESPVHSATVPYQGASNAAC
jgi:hypothetical protein